MEITSQLYQLVTGEIGVGSMFFVAKRAGKPQLNQ